MRAALLVLTVAALAGCNPTLRGECTNNDECPSGTTCVEGLCLAGSSVPDAGGCSPACSSGEQCVDGMCHSSGAAEVVILSPSGGTFGAVALPVSVQAMAPEGVTSVSVALNDAHGSPVLSTSTTPGSAADTYDASLNLDSPAVTDGSYSIVAMMTHGGQTAQSTAVPITITREKPTVHILPIPYPANGTSFLRSDTIEVDADVAGGQVPLAAQPAQLVIAGMPPVNGTLVSGQEYKFTFSGRTPPFNAVKGPVQFQVKATNALGSVATASGSFDMTRIKWTWTKSRKGTVSAAPTLAQHLLVVGSDDGYLYGIHPGDGSVAWEVNVGNVGGNPVGHLTTGANLVYAALDDGHLVAVDPSSQSVQFQCPQGPGGFGSPALHKLNSGFALGTTQAPTDPSAQETLFAFTTDGYVSMYRRDPFPGMIGAPPSCLQDSAALNVVNDASPPALVQDSDGIHLFFGDQGGAVHAVTVSLTAGNPVQPATFQLSEDWRRNLGLPVHGGVAFATLPPGTGLLAVREDAVVDALDLGGMFLWTPPPMSLTGKVRATPVIGTAGIETQDLAGNLQTVSTSDGTPKGSMISTGTPASSTSVNAAPIATADGRVYFGSGTQLFSVGPSGSIEWTYQPTQPGVPSTTFLDVVTPEFSCDGTLFAVAVNKDRAVVHALITDSLTGLAPTTWPRAFHDSHNTLNTGSAISTGGACAD